MRSTVWSATVDWNERVWIAARRVSQADPVSWRRPRACVTLERIRRSVDGRLNSGVSRIVMTSQTPALFLQNAGIIATVATAVFAVVALFFAWRQIVVSRRESRLGTARGIYREYLSMAFGHPEMSSASYPVEAPGFHRLKNDPVKFEAYEFYVSHLLFAAETILELSKNEEKWRGVLKDQLRYHALYIRSDAFPRHHYDQDLLTVADEAIADYLKDAAGH